MDILYYGSYQYIINNNNDTKRIEKSINQLLGYSKSFKERRFEAMLEGIINYFKTFSSFYNVEIINNNIHVKLKEESSLNIESLNIYLYTINTDIKEIENNKKFKNRKTSVNIIDIEAISVKNWLLFHNYKLYFYRIGKINQQLDEYSNYTF